MMLMCASSMFAKPNLEVLPVSELEVGGDDNAREEAAVVLYKSVQKRLVLSS